MNVTNDPHNRKISRQKLNFHIVHLPVPLRFRWRRRRRAKNYGVRSFFHHRPRKNVHYYPEPKQNCVCLTLAIPSHKYRKTGPEKLAPRQAFTAKLYK